MSRGIVGCLDGCGYGKYYKVLGRCWGELEGWVINYDIIG
jgi:hypothetical protein